MDTPPKRTTNHELSYEPLPANEPDWHNLLIGAVPFVEACQRELSAAKRAGRRAGLLVLGFNSFSGTDAETFPGLQAGLSKLALERLGYCLRGGDACAHLGGDLFAIAPRDTGEAAALALMGRRLLHAFREPLKWGERTFVAVPAIGIAQTPRDGDNPRALIRNGWLAQARAWELNRARFRFASEDVNQALAVEMTHLAAQELGIAGAENPVAFDVQESGVLTGMLVHSFRAALPAHFAWNGPALHDPQRLGDQLLQARFAVGWSGIRAQPDTVVELMLPQGFMRQRHAASSLMAMLGGHQGASNRTRLWVPYQDLLVGGPVERNLRLARQASMRLGAAISIEAGLPAALLQRLQFDALLLLDPPGVNLEAGIAFLSTTLPGATVLSFSERANAPGLILRRLVRAHVLEAEPSGRLSAPQA